MFWLFWAVSSVPLQAEAPSLEKKPSLEENPPVLKASDFLSEDLLKGPTYAVDPEVPTDGFLAYFTVHSDFGTFRTASVRETQQRIHEIRAVGLLRDMKRYEVAGEALVEGVKQPFLAVKNVLTQPEETAENLGAGVGRWIERGKLSLRKAARKTKEVARDAKESYEQRRAEKATEVEEAETRPEPETARSGLAAQSDAYRYQKQIEWTKDQLQKASLRYIGYDKARRRLAQELQVDPYSTNLTLQKELDAMAWALWVGRLGSGWAIPASDALGYVLKVDDLVWRFHPKDLEVENRKRLKSIEVPRDTVDSFFDNKYYTPSDQTAMVNALVGLDGVADRDHFFQLAQGVDGRLLAEFYGRSADLLTRAHAEKPLERIVRQTEKLVAGLTRSGDLALFLAVDYLSWTANVERMALGVDRQIREASFDGDVILWVDGGLSESAARELQALGWKIESGG